MTSDFLGDSPPIFILGMSRRTGTNFLWDLIRLHPACTSPGVIWEDFLSSHADLLVTYAAQVSAHWNPTWGVDRSLGSDAICRHLGIGIISFLDSQKAHTQAAATGLDRATTTVSSTVVGRRVVTKTPSVRSLEHFFRIFPQAQLLVLVRDGRAVVESSVKSFKHNYEDEMRQWAFSARTILKFQEGFNHGEAPYMLVRYEDLCKNREFELRRIFSFLKLNPDIYDFAAANDLPIRGSSTLTAQGTQVHWEPVKKTATFDPVRRWAHWSRALHERFNWITGDCLEKFGYQKKLYDRSRLWWSTWNRVLDARYSARRFWHRTTRALQRATKFNRGGASS